jgi:AraC-like DNA-binding protein
MLLGPLLLFYTQSLLDPSFRMGSSQWRQFYPVFLDWIPPLIGWTFMAGLLLGLLTEAQGPVWGNIMDLWNVYADGLRWLSLAGYLIFTRRWLGQQQLKDDFREDVKWLKQLLLVLQVFLLIWLLHLLPYLIPATRQAVEDTLGWYPVYIPIAVMIYWLGLKGWLHSRNRALPETSVPETAGKASNSSALSDDAVEMIISRLKEAMHADKLYLDPELTVNKVGKHVKLPARAVSFVLNQHMEKSFNTFVNEYRIEAVKTQLTGSASRQFTITGIAFTCGFNSQATFQRTFRQITGMSPTEYLSRQATA